MCSFEIEYYEVGKVCSMFILTTKDQELVALVEGRSVACRELVIVKSNELASYPSELQEYLHSCPPNSTVN